MRRAVEKDLVTSCGGPHLQKNCPRGWQAQGQGKGKAYAVWEETPQIKPMCCVRIVEPTENINNEEPGSVVNIKNEEPGNGGNIEIEELVCTPCGMNEEKETPKSATRAKVNRWSKNVNNGVWTEVQHKKKKKKNIEKVNMLGIVESKSVAAVTESEWEEIEMAVDSGASESVMNADTLPSVPMTEGDAKRRGVRYEVADGTLIPNEGEKSFVAMDENGTTRGLKMQVTDVNKALLSVRRITQAGNRVILEEDHGWIEDKSTGECMPLTMKEGMYMIKMWVKRGGVAPDQGFQGPA